MQVVGGLDLLMEKEHFSTQTGTFLRGFSSKTKLMERVRTRTLMDKNTKETGSMIFSMAQVLKFSRMVLIIAGSLGTARNTVWAPTAGPMVQVTKASGAETRLKDSVFLNGRTVGVLKEAGREISFMVVVSILGQMVEATMASISKTRSRDSGYTSGLMEKNTRATGTTASSTARASLQTNKANLG